MIWQQVWHRYITNHRICTDSDTLPAHCSEVSIHVCISLVRLSDQAGGHNAENVDDKSQKHPPEAVGCNQHTVVRPLELRAISCEADVFE